MNFESLVGRINLIQDALQAQAAHAVNLSLTARNWLVGYYIVEFEQHGGVVAEYVFKNGQNEILRLPTAKLQTEDFLTDEKLRLSTAKSTKEECHTVPGLCLSLCDMSLCDTN